MLSTAGDVASVIGFPIGLIGLIITLREARRAREAAEGARLAAEEAVSRIKIQVFIEELSACLRFVRKIDESCRERRWKEAVESCDEARTRLARIGESDALVIAEKDSLSLAISQIGRLMPYLQKIRKDPRGRTRSNLPSQKTNELHLLITSLAQIQGRLRFLSIKV